MDATAADRQAGAWLCANLPELRQDADEHGWRQLLEQQVQAVLRGGSAQAALQRLGLRSDPGQVGRDRHPSPSIGTAKLWEPAQRSGHFRCPHTAGGGGPRCDRTTRDLQGRWPVCYLDPTPGGTPLPPVGGTGH